MAMNMNSPLPSGWEARWDGFSGRYYFIDHSTQQTTWTDPRISSAVLSRPHPEQIPMQDLSVRHLYPRESSAQSNSRGQTASTAQTKETGFNSAISAANDEDDLDEEWRSIDLQLSTMDNDKKKHLMFHEKINMKEKFKREFKELDGGVVESTVEKNDYEEDLIRATLESLKDERKKREEKKRRDKQAEEARKAAERIKEMNRMKKLIKERKEAEMKAELEAKSKHEFEIKRKAELEIKRKGELKIKRKAELEAEKRRAATSAASKEATATVSVVNAGTSSGQKAMATTKETRRPLQKAATKMAPVKPLVTTKSVGEKQIYISANRLQPVGPQVSLRKGPDPKNLTHLNNSASGPNKAFVSGPQRSNYNGPSALQQKVSISKGPQASLRQGPQSRLIYEQGRSAVTSTQLPRIVSAV